MEHFFQVAENIPAIFCKVEVPFRDLLSVIDDFTNTTD
jgi:hypothetical protein